MIRYSEPVIRPPSEADSLILQATIGCSHNRCAFCVTYQNKRFRARPRDELAAEIDWAGLEMPEIRKVFLGDGDALALSTGRLLKILARLYDRLPALRRVSAYASPHNFRNKSADDLQRLRQAGLQLIYVGLESGDDEVLERIDKGVTADEMAALLAKPTAAGIKLFVTTVLGLGGPRLTTRHADNTASLLDRIHPRFASALTLTLLPRDPSFEEIFGDSSWRLLTADEFLVECRRLIAGIESRGLIFYANHASNYVQLQGTLPKDKTRLLSAIDAALADPSLRRAEHRRGL